MSDYTPTTENIRNCYVYSHEQYDGSLAAPIPVVTAEFERWLAAVKADVWAEGVSTALNHAVRNEDGVTLRLEHLDGHEWANPYKPAGAIGAES